MAERDGFRADQSAWHLGTAAVCVYVHVCTHICACMCTHVCMSLWYVRHCLRQGGLPGSAANRARRVAVLPEEPPHLLEGGLPSPGAAGCRWSDIKFCPVSHLVAALAGRENSRGPAVGSGQAVLAWHDPPVTLRRGRAQLTRRVPLPPGWLCLLCTESESAPRAEVLASGPPDRVQAPRDIARNALSVGFLLSDPHAPGLGG